LARKFILGDSRANGMRFKAATVAVLLVASMVGGAVSPAAAQQADGESYAGTHVQFETNSDAISDYAVDGTVLVENVSVQSASEARSQSGFDLDAGLASSTDFRAAGLGIDSRTRVSVSVRVDSGAEMQAHDTQRGVLQIRSGGERQLVRANLSSGVEARSESDRRVVVTNRDGSQGTFIVVGDGEVVVDENGGVTADVGSDGQLVYRQYEDGRSDADAEAERMIQNGTATAEVYVREAAEQGENSAEDGEQTARESQDDAVQVVRYGQDTTVEVTGRSRDSLDTTVERTESDGKVVLYSVSNAAIEGAEDLEVFVDGEAAARADSYSAVEQSAREGDQPRYHVSQSSSAEATTDVAVGIDHFSARNVRLASGGDGSDDGSGGSGDDGSSLADGSGFGALVALGALAAALIAARRR
jgi:hypothetical protein